MPEQPKDLIDGIEREWALRKEVEQAHSIFHMRPGIVIATKLSHAVAAWLANATTETRPDDRTAD